MRLPLRGICGVLPVAMAFSACSPGPHAPTLAVFGSFFPIWLFAAALGLVCALVLRGLLLRLGLHEHLPVPTFTYFCATLLFSILIWAQWTGELQL